MKQIELHSDKPFESIEIFLQVLGVSPTRSLSLDEVRKRSRVMDIIEKRNGQAGPLLLEDADHATLVKAFEDFGYSVSHPKLVRVIDAVIDAKDAKG